VIPSSGMEELSLRFARNTQGQAFNKFETTPVVGWIERPDEAYAPMVVFQCSAVTWVRYVNWMREEMKASGWVFLDAEIVTRTVVTGNE